MQQPKSQVHECWTQAEGQRASGSLGKEEGVGGRQSYRRGTKNKAVEEGLAGECGKWELQGGTTRTRMHCWGAGGGGGLVGHKHCGVRWRCSSVGAPPRAKQTCWARRVMGPRAACCGCRSARALWSSSLAGMRGALSGHIHSQMLWNVSDAMMD